MSNEVLATVLTAVVALIVQLSVSKMDYHKSEAHELREELEGAKKELAEARKEAEDYKQKYYNILITGVPKD